MHDALKLFGVMEVWVIITSVVSACSTYFVAHELNQGGIRASAGLSFIVGLRSEERV